MHTSVLKSIILNKYSSNEANQQKITNVFVHFIASDVQQIFWKFNEET